MESRTRRPRLAIKHWFCGLFALAVITGHALPTSAQNQATDTASEPPALTFGGDFWSRSKLTGDWGGMRDGWAAQGFTVDLDVTYTLQGVTTGGIPNTGTPLGNTTLGDLVFGLDTQRPSSGRALHPAPRRADRGFRACAPAPCRPSTTTRSCPIARAISTRTCSA
jgi:hypothetical protein